MKPAGQSSSFRSIDAAAQFIFPQKLTLFSDLVIVYTLPASLLDIKIFNAFLVI